MYVYILLNYVGANGKINVKFCINLVKFLVVHDIYKEFFFIIKQIKINPGENEL